MQDFKHQSHAASNGKVQAQWRSCKPSLYQELPFHDTQQENVQGSCIYCILEDHLSGLNPWMALGTRLWFCPAVSFVVLGTLYQSNTAYWLDENDVCVQWRVVLKSTVSTGRSRHLLEGEKSVFNVLARSRSQSKLSSRSFYFQWQIMGRKAGKTGKPRTGIQNPASQVEEATKVCIRGRCCESTRYLHTTITKHSH